MDERDEAMLRLSFRVARAAAEHGNLPFGAVLVDADGQVVLEAETTTRTDHDPTGHAETNLLRDAGRRFEPEYLAGCTLYSSAEPCVMCAGAAHWVGVGRIVYGLDIIELDAIIAGNPLSRNPLVRAEDVLKAGNVSVRLEGPALVDEAAAVHREFWAASSEADVTGRNRES
jgi:tRNA(Arg) A34 adenosine deaminase TadA